MAGVPWLFIRADDLGIRVADDDASRGDSDEQLRPVLQRQHVADRLDDHDGAGAASQSAIRTAFAIKSWPPMMMRTTDPAQALVMDHIERPSEN